MVMYSNGRYLDENEAVVSVFDHGYLYGIGFFETFRTYNGKPFLLEEHLERLQEALNTVSIDWCYDATNIKDIVAKLLQKNHMKDAYFRLNVSAGIGILGLTTDAYVKPTTLLYCKELPVQVAEKEAVIVSQTRNTPEGSIRTKSHHYMNNILAKREIKDKPMAEGIFLTKDGYVAEGIVSNIFFRKNNYFFTPSLETGILEGVTRNYIIQLLKKLGYCVQEGLYTIEDLQRADEVFITNSIQEVVRISSIMDVAEYGEESAVMIKLKRMYKQQAEGE